MRIPLGRKAKLSFSVSGDTFTETKRVSDVALNLTKVEDDDTARASDGWETTAGTMKQAAVEFQMKTDGTDAFFIALQNSYLNDTPLRIRLDAAKTGLVNGPQFTAWCECFQLNRTENLKEIVKYQVSLKPTSPPEGKASETPAFIAVNDEDPESGPASEDEFGPASEE